MKDKLAEFVFRPRGVGNNWTPCFICGHKPQQKCQYDMAAFVDPNLITKFQALSTVDPIIDHPITTFFHENDIYAELDYRQHEPNRVQLKLGACGEHVPNLRLLEALCYGDGKITQFRLTMCIPERKRP